MFILPSCIRSLVRFYDSHQVELQGSYSVTRLQEFVEYFKTVTVFRACLIAFATLIPCIIAMIVTDALPLKDPFVGGVKGQTATYWIRHAFCLSLLTITALGQLHHASPRQKMKVRHVVTTLCVNLPFTMLCILVLHLVEGFPSPFLYQQVSAVWNVSLLATVWMQWKQEVLADVETQKDIRRYMWCWASQVVMPGVYPVLQYGYATLSRFGQAAILIVLPVWKLALKLWVSYGVFRLEDLAPVFIVFTVDVFHSLFLSCAQQSSTNNGYSALVVTMVVDFIQSFAAVSYVHMGLTRLKSLEKAFDTTVRTQQGEVQRKDTSPSPAFLQAYDILANDEQIRQHPLLIGARHEQTVVNSPIKERVMQSLTSFKKLSTRLRQGRSTKVIVTQTPGPDKAAILDQTNSTAQVAKLQYVRESLQLLHMIEFYMLIEFAEFVVSLIYAVFLLVTPQLPNRLFYKQIRLMSNEQWQKTVFRVTAYSALELLSLILLAFVFRRQLGYSPIRQVAFALNKHWWLVQSPLVMWVFMAIQMNLDHLGADYSFKFKWLHGPRH